MRYKRFFGPALIAAMLPVSYLVVNPYGAMNMALIKEQKIDISGNINFYGAGNALSRVTGSDSFSFVCDKSGTSSVRIEFWVPVDFYKNSIVFFARCKQSDEILSFSLTDSNSFTTAYTSVAPAAVSRGWGKVIISKETLSGIWNVDKRKIISIRLIPEKKAWDKARVIEIKDIALRPAAGYNQ